MLFTAINPFLILPYVNLGLKVFYPELELVFTTVGNTETYFSLYSIQRYIPDGDFLLGNEFWSTKYAQVCLPA